VWHLVGANRVRQDDDESLSAGRLVLLAKPKALNASAKVRTDRAGKAG
jgi:hypothetical protein